MSDHTLKYVVIHNPDTNKLRVGVTAKFRYHMDIFGEKPKAPWRVWSAGYYTVTDGDPKTLRTHDKSEGFNIGPKSGDEIMLRAFETEGDDEFDLNTIREQHRAALAQRLTPA